MMLLHRILSQWRAIGSKESQWVLEDYSPSIALTDALGLEAVAAYGLFFPALDSTFATCYGVQSIFASSEHIPVSLLCLLKQPVLVRLFGTLRGPGGRAAGGSVDWAESTYAIEASAAHSPVAAWESSLMGNLGKFGSRSRQSSIVNVRRHGGV